MVVHRYPKPKIKLFAGCEQVEIQPTKYPIIDTDSEHIPWMDYSENLTVNDIQKINLYIDCFKSLKNVPGDVIELGVFRGSNLKLIGLAYDFVEPHSRRNILGFDTFEGFPSEQLVLAQEQSKSSVYSDTGNLDAAIKKMANLKRSVRLIKGDVLDTIPKYLEQWSNRSALIYLDLDLEEPTRLALEMFSKKMSKGGKILLDQYSRDGWSETNVVDEFLNKYDSEFEFTTIPNSTAPTACLTKK